MDLVHVLSVVGGTVAILVGCLFLAVHRYGKLHAWTGWGLILFGVVGLIDEIVPGRPLIPVHIIIFVAIMAIVFRNYQTQR